jgi:glyoxylase-like metal-dependent hydrolase (beta-lactamase superfamily II)
LTHGHVDHSGHAGLIKERNPNVTIFVHEDDAVYITDFEGYTTNRMESYTRMITENGAPEFIRDMMNSEYLRQHFTRYGRPCAKVNTIQDGFHITTGIGELTVISTPGHSRGSVCYVSPESRIIFTGDHILGDISSNPSLDFDNPTRLSMLVYFDSLERVIPFSNYYALPGHRKPIDHLKDRISFLKEDYKSKLNLLSATLNSTPQSIYEISKKLYGDYPPDSIILALAETHDLARLLEMEQRAEVVLINNVRYVVSI